MNTGTNTIDNNPINFPSGGPTTDPYYQKNDIFINNDIEYGLTYDINYQLRMAFVRKVYGILSVQLLITTMLVGLAFIPVVSGFIYRNFYLFYFAMFSSIILILTMFCVPNIFRSVPTNYILLFLWTSCEAYMVATAASFYPPEIVLYAVLLTTIVVVTLTVYALTTKTDFTFLTGLMFALTSVLFFWGLFTLIFGFFLYTVYCVLGVFVFSLYLILDTQLIFGRYGQAYLIDDYILAALNIYIDIIQLFLYILQLMKRN